VEWGYGDTDSFKRALHKPWTHPVVKELLTPSVLSAARKGIVLVIAQTAGAERRRPQGRVRKGRRKSQCQPFPQMTTEGGDGDREGTCFVEDLQ